MNYKIEDYITHIDNLEDKPYLRFQLFNVNMRLFKSSFTYRDIILQVCQYIKWLCSETMEGYKKPHGMSGANAGIPWNIICYTKNRGKKNESYEIMINPRITHYGGDLVETSSNCGSIRLKKPIKIRRNSVIDVEYYDEQGIKRESTFTRYDGGFTIQHEVDHNLGVLIIDKAI